MRKEWRFSYRNKLIVTFMLVSLLPVLIVQMVSYYVSSDSMKRKIGVLVEANLLQTSKNLDTSLQAYDDLVFQIVTNDDIVRLVREVNKPGEEVELSKRRLINMLSSYSYAKAGIRSVAILTRVGTVVCYDRQSGSPFHNLWSDIPDPTVLPLYRQAVESRTGSVMSIPAKMDDVPSGEEYAFHLARKLTDYNALSLDSIGVVVVTVYESVLAQAINLDEPEGGQARQIDNRNYLADARGVIVSSPDKRAIGQTVDDIRTGATISNAFANTRSGLTIYNLIDQRKLFAEMYAMQRLTIAVGAAAVIVAILLIYYFSGRLTDAIRRVIKAMRIASQGSLTVQIEEGTRDEMSVIALNFNKMIVTINKLMDEVKAMGEKRKEAEIRALEAQLNPHFLYNTLDSINWLAIEKEEHQISQMLKGLAQILRYSIKDSNKLVPVREELDWMDKYIFLQQFRFRSSFVCAVERDERALDRLIPKLILQPFIENAIIHGFAGMKQGGKLDIGIRLRAEDALELTVRDNGAGMDAATLAGLLADDAGGGPPSGIGIRNARERLRMVYGDRATCDIASRPGEGTEVRIVLPTMPKGEST